jgi:serine protease DegS
MSTHPPRLIQRTRTKLLLASAAAAILATGAALRRDEPVRTRQEPVAPILEARVERREPTRLFRAIQDAAARVRAYGVVFPAQPARARRRSVPDFAAARPAAPEPAGLGIPVGESGEVLTTRPALAGGQPRVLTADGRRMEASVAAYDPERALVLVQLEEARPPAPAMASAPPTPGDLVLAAAGAYEMVAPRFVRSVGEQGYLLDAAGLPPGTPLFNLDGELLGIAAGGESHLVHPVADALARLRGLVAEGRELPATLGILLQEPDAGLRARLGAGLIVAGVEPDGPAATAGVRAGDVLLELGGSPVDDLEAAHRTIAALPAGREVTATLGRAGLRQTLTLLPAATFADPRAAWALASPGAPAASDVFAAGDLAEADVPPSSRVLSVDGRPLAAARLPPAARRQGPPWLVHLHEGGRPFFAVVGRERR